MSEHALTPGDPRRTIHFLLGRAVSRRMGGDTPPVDGIGDSMLAWTASDDDPDARRSYAVQIAAAWGFLGFAFAVAMVLSVPIKSLAGVATGNAYLTGCLAAGMFCMAGCANVLWRMYYYVPKARRLGRKGGTYTEAYAAAMRRTLPRNTSLVVQTAAVIVTLILAL